MSLCDFERKLASLWPIDDWADLTVIVAVSGGADSVALLRGLHTLRCDLAQSGISSQGRLLVVHINHLLRGDESDADAEFVRELASQLDLPSEFIIAADEFVVSKLGDGIEAAARNARYTLLEKAAGQHGARYIVTAHTADDQAETVLHRIIRGTGLRGLAGMARARRLGCATLLRPLLAIRRAELTEYLSELGQSFRLDSSNDNLDFTRNRIRHQVIPLVEQTINPGFADALRRLAMLAGEAQSAIDESIETLFARCVLSTTREVRVNVGMLADIHRHVVRELFSLIWRHQEWPMRAMGFDEWELLAAMAVDRRPYSATLPGAIEATLADKTLILQKQQARSEL